MVITPRLAIKARVLEGWLVAGIGRVVWIGLTSQEGCSCLVVRNFGRRISRERRLKSVDMEEFGGERLGWQRGQRATCEGSVVWAIGNAGLEAQLRRV